MPYRQKLKPHFQLSTCSINTYSYNLIHQYLKGQKKSMDEILKENEEMNNKLKSMDSKDKQMNQEIQQLRGENLRQQKQIDELKKGQAKNAGLSLSTVCAGGTAAKAVTEKKSGIY